ncbi:deoxyribonuclease V [Gloeothece citriformis]|uniref:deoxyribonuclease V n=1 Tax=Gloeothece citriformis TaxID=2546356 RepID=UPI00059DAF5C|nr:deoxyribonuclease V [Gloeothece citriformis]
MNIPSLSSWPTDIEEATLIQQQLRHQVSDEDQLGDIRYVAGVDVGFKDNYTITQAAVAVLTFPELELVDKAIVTLPTCFPYIPGFLSFREVPGILKALEKLTITPNLMICDGQGIAHPRRFGIACHLGVLIDVPTIGVAKSILVGKHSDLPPEKGSRVDLIYKGKTIGVVLRSRTNVKPLYVSIGHKISLTTAVDYVFNCLTKYRLPETTRLADKLSREKVDNL